MVKQTGDRVGKLKITDTNVDRILLLPKSLNRIGTVGSPQIGG
jgi:hypothetical protein